MLGLDVRATACPDGGREKSRCAVALKAETVAVEEVPASTENRIGSSPGEVQDRPGPMLVPTLSPLMSWV